MEYLKFKPCYKETVWGGKRLSEYGKTAEFERLGESWEISAHPDGMSVISGGLYDGVAFADYIKEHNEVLGENCKTGYFPVLIKYIDANDDLSVQVHPTDETAKLLENENGKTETWYVVDAVEGAEIVYGVEKEISAEAFRYAMENGDGSVLHREKVKKGDAFFVRGGTVHAIGKGCLIAEIQQNSNITYRLYDYGRVGKDGKKRELHLDKAMRCVSLIPTENPRFSGNVVAECEYFTVKKYESDALLNVGNESYLALLCVEGGFSVNGDTVKSGDTLFFPAGYGEIKIAGKGVILTCEN